MLLRCNVNVSMHYCYYYIIIILIIILLPTVLLLLVPKLNLYLLFMLFLGVVSSGVQKSTRTTVVATVLSLQYYCYTLLYTHLRHVISTGTYHLPIIRYNYS
jgi:hypothetical protein